MKKSEKLYTSLGSVRDEWLDDAIAADITKNKAKSGTKTVALRRLLIAAAVCVLSVSLAITCVANADLIKSLFQREQELINPYAAMIDETVETDGVSMRVDKIAKDGDRYIIYLHLSRPEGFEPGYLTHNGIEFEQETEDGWISRAEITGTKNANTALLAGLFLTEVKEKTNELDLLITIDSRLDTFYFINEVEKDNFRLTINDLATVQFVEENGGTAKYSEEYADELTVDFEFDASKIEPLPEKVSYPDIEFEVDGSKFRITEMRYSPLHLELHIEDPTGETFEIGGKELFATDKISMQMFTVDNPPTKAPQIPDGATEEELEEIRRKTEKFGEWSDEHFHEFKFYSLAVDTTLERDSRYGYTIAYETENDEYNPNKLVLTKLFDVPVYEEDILSISFESYFYEDYPITPDTEYTVDRVIVWENPNAVNPEAADTNAE